MGRVRYSGETRRYDSERRFPASMPTTRGSNPVHELILEIFGVFVLFLSAGFVFFWLASLSMFNVVQATSTDTGQMHLPSRPDYWDCNPRCAHRIPLSGRPTQSGWWSGWWKSSLDDRDAPNLMLLVLHSKLQPHRLPGATFGSFWRWVDWPSLFMCWSFRA